MPDTRLMAGCTLIVSARVCAPVLAQPCRSIGATCGVMRQNRVAACMQMPGGNAEEPLTLLSSDEDVPAQPVGRQNATGAGVHRLKHQSQLLMLMPSASLLDSSVWCQMMSAML